MTHEVGHALIGQTCAGHPSEPQCGGVMQAIPSPRDDLGYTDQFIDIVRAMYPLMVTERPLYTAVWQPSMEGEIQLYGWTYEDYRAKYDELWEQGWRLKLLNPYVIDNSVRYTAVFRPSTKGEIRLYGWAYEDYRAEYDKLWEQGWRLKLLSPF
jgi:hypothetical protein